MKFVNAIAWLGLCWGTLWLVVMLTCLMNTRGLIQIQYQIIWYRRAWFFLALSLISASWLIYGG